MSCSTRTYGPLNAEDTRDEDDSTAASATKKPANGKGRALPSIGEEDGGSTDLYD